jgi:hypothetical protein
MLSNSDKLAICLFLLDGVLTMLLKMYPHMSYILGWTIIIIFILMIIVFSRGILKKDSILRKGKNKEEALNIHQKIIELDTKLWETKDRLPENEDLQKNAEIVHIMDELLSETNKLGHLVNSSEYDSWVEAWMQSYSRFLEFHHPMHDENGTFARTRLNSNLRRFIRKVRG